MNQTFQMGLAGREALLNALAEHIRPASEGDTSVSVALVDLDRFGEVNAQHGLEVGDVVLQAVAQRLTNLDFPGKVVSRQAFRAGEDEFVLLLPGAEKEDAFLLLERERAAFAGTHEFELQGRTVSVPLSFGAAVATFPEDGARPQDVMRKASDALYRAKTSGRNRVCLAREERMVTKTSHYTQAQLARLSHLAKRDRIGEAVLLREALDELLRRYGV